MSHGADVRRIESQLFSLKGSQVFRLVGRSPGGLCPLEPRYVGGKDYALTGLLNQCLGGGGTAASNGKHDGYTKGMVELTRGLSPRRQHYLKSIFAVRGPPDRFSTKGNRGAEARPPAREHPPHVESDVHQIKCGRRVLLGRL